MTTPSTKTPSTFPPKDAAAMLNVSRQHIYKLIKTGEIKSVLIGRSRRISLVEIERVVAGDAA